MHGRSRRRRRYRVGAATPTCTRALRAIGVESGRQVASRPEVSGHLVGSAAFKAVGTGDPRPAGSIPVHLRQYVHGRPGMCLASALIREFVKSLHRRPWAFVERYSQGHFQTGRESYQPVAAECRRAPGATDDVLDLPKAGTTHRRRTRFGLGTPAATRAGRGLRHGSHRPRSGVTTPRASPWCSDRPRPNAPLAFNR